MKHPLIILFLMTLACTPSPRNTVAPEDAAKHFLEATKTSYEGLSCTGTPEWGDDAYVRCFVRLPKTDATQLKYLTLLCAAIPPAQSCDMPPPSYTTGCKPL